MPSVILNDTILKGTLSQKDSITIDGTFIGNITAEEIIVKIWALSMVILMRVRTLK